MRIATVDAVSGHTIEATLSIDARGQPLKGALVTTQCDTDVLLGRIVSVDLTNVVHQNETFAPFIMQHGAIAHWSGDVDIERAKIELIRAIDENGKPIAMRRNPPSGTPIVALDRHDLSRFETERNHSVAVGYIPNTGDLLATLVNRHFGAFDEGGYGEARHTAIFGQNGSGKSVLGLTLLAARLAMHPKMGLLMPDTAGDLCNPNTHSRGDFRWNYVEVLKAAGITPEIINLADVRLTARRTLRDKLAPVLREELSMAQDQSQTLAQRVTNVIVNGKKVLAAEVTPDQVMAAVVDEIEHCYAPATKKQRRESAVELSNNPRQRRTFDEKIRRIAVLFDGREEIGHLIERVLMRGAKVIIDAGLGIADEDKELLMRELMVQLTWRAEEAFKKRSNQSVNALVVLDEGQRWIPESGGDDRGIARIITRALRETRKYGLGWMVIAQSPSGVSKELLRQAHTKYFGRGLGIGADATHLRAVLGDAGLETYHQMELQGGFFWIGNGHDNNIGTESSYFAFQPFDGDATNQFIYTNPRIFGRV